MHGEIIAPVIGAVGAGRTVLKHWTNEAPPLFFFLPPPPKKIKPSISGTFWGLPGCHLCDAVIPQVLPGGNALTVQNAWVLEERQRKRRRGNGRKEPLLCFYQPHSTQGNPGPLPLVCPCPWHQCSLCQAEDVQHIPIPGTQLYNLYCN